MAAGKHPKTRRPSDADLRGDPGIGRSRDAERTDEPIGGENTFAGEVPNDPTPQGGIDPRQHGRTNG